MTSSQVTFRRNLTNYPQDKIIEERIGIEFADRDILHKALVHKSFLNENSEETDSNERLEFLGDAILEFIVSRDLYVRFPTENEGHLTALRAKLVNTISLAGTARKLGLGEGLYLSRGEEKGKGRESTSLLANTFEAITGAIFVDQGIEKATEFISRQILSKIPEVVKKSLKDPKSLLQEYVQAGGFPAPTYKTVASVGPDHAKLFKVEVFVNRKPYAAGEGSSKQQAAQVAAENALAKWDAERP